MSYIRDAVQSNWIAPVGPDIEAFEQALSSFLEIDNVLATNSGTSAIHLGLLALGVGKGDEVICSTFTFCASANPIRYCGAVPVFVDSEEVSWNMDPMLLEEAIVDRLRKTGRKPKAIVVVHIYGMPAPLKEILEISRRHDVPVLEDAAEALGSQYAGQQVGTFGDVGAFSFNGNKIITTSGGGALCTPESGIYRRAKYLGAEAREPVDHYEHNAVGYNYRLSNLLAAVGRSQMKVLNDRIERRRAIFNFYKAELATDSSIGFQTEPAETVSNRWLTCITFSKRPERRDALRVVLEKEQIETRMLWKPMHLQPVFRDFPSYTKGISEALFHSGLCLPSGSSLAETDLTRIIEIVKREL